MAGDAAQQIQPNANDPAFEQSYASTPQHIKAELIGGLLMQSAPPANRHALASIALVMAC